eukprot:715967-Rhodomonas_salina.1
MLQFRQRQKGPGAPQRGLETSRGTPSSPERYRNAPCQGSSTRVASTGHAVADTRGRYQKWRSRYRTYVAGTGHGVAHARTRAYVSIAEQYQAESRTRNLIPGTNRTEKAVSCI